MNKKIVRTCPELNFSDLKKGDLLVRWNNGSKHEPFRCVVIEVEKSRIKVDGSGYIGGCIYGQWWGYFTSLEHCELEHCELEVSSE